MFNFVLDITNISVLMVFLPAFLAGIFYFRSPVKWFNWYLFGCLITEISLWYTSGIGLNNWWIVYSFLLFEVLFLGLTFHYIVIGPLLKKMILYSTFAVLLLAVLLNLYGYKYLMHHIQNTFLILVAGAFIVDFIANDKSFELWQSGKLWIGVGVFFYFFSSSLVFILIEPMLSSNDETLGNIYNMLHSVINIISYLCYSYALVCRK